MPFPSTLLLVTFCHHTNTKQSVSQFTCQLCDIYPLIEEQQRRLKWSHSSHQLINIIYALTSNILSWLRVSSIFESAQGSRAPPGWSTFKIKWIFHCVCKGVLKNVTWCFTSVWICKSAQLWEGIWSCFWLGYSPFPSTEICCLSCHRLACITFNTSSCPSLRLHSSINKRGRDARQLHVLQVSLKA